MANSGWNSISWRPDVMRVSNFGFCICAWASHMHKKRKYWSVQYALNTCMILHAKLLLTVNILLSFALDLYVSGCSTWPTKQPQRHGSLTSIISGSKAIFSGPGSRLGQIGRSFHLLGWRKKKLVGGWPTPLKNMKVSWDDYSQYMEK